LIASGAGNTVPWKPLPSCFFDCEAYGGAVKIIASIDDPVVIPTALAALAGQALKQIRAPLQRKAESKELNPLPESRVSG